MIIEIEESNNKLSATQKSIVVIHRIGLQGAKGSDGKNAYPDNGNIGALLEKQENGVAWTNQPTNIELNGGYF